MELFLDNERLNGPHVARISARPRRIALPLDSSELSSFRRTIELECQLWGGGSNIIIPIGSSGLMPHLYRNVLPGSQIDDVHGIDYDPEMELAEAPNLRDARDVTRSQLAVGLLDYRQPDKMIPVEIVKLHDDDPWAEIYAACLGSLPGEIDPAILRSGDWLPGLQFSDWVEMRRSSATGSIDDLIERTWPRKRVWTPRQLSLVKLSYANTASSTIRVDTPVLPDPRFARFDAGPNILVVCSPGSMDDLALLWNLRAAHGDFYATPIGIPTGELTADIVRKLKSAAGLARHGLSASTLYITSTSVPVGALEETAGGISDVSVRSPSDLLMFGTILGLARDEILIWTDGRASYKPLDSASYRDVLANRNVNELLMMQYDVQVEDAPLPISDDYRVDPFNGAFYNASHTIWSSPRTGEKVSSVEWPSREIIANSLASIRDLEVVESAPGIAARILIEMLGGLSDVHLLRHAPILDLLESMSARHGFNWYKERLRQVGVEARYTDAVGSSIDELPEKSFHEFKRAIGNNETATKYWLAWAERSRIIIKGFPLQCPRCGAKQWIPVGNFAPPILCRGCAKTIEHPFGDRPIVDFKYRLSEQARRVYESDAMGHILAAGFFASVFGSGTQSRLIGLQPGSSVRRTGASMDIGEADILLLTRWGEFIPIEVKRTATGLNDHELEKLATLSGTLKAPWSGVVACQYAEHAGEALTGLGTRNADGTHERMVLTYDHLLQPHPMWGLGGDPFAPTKLSAAEINKREKEFVASLTMRASDANVDWLAYSMKRRRKAGNQ